MAKRKNRHPVIEHYLAGQKLLAILRGLPEPAEPVVRALRLLMESLENPADHDAALEAIGVSQGVDPAGSDLDLVVLWYAMWAFISVREGRLAEAGALHRRAHALGDGAVMPDVMHTLLSSEGVLASMLGDKNRRLEIIARQRTAPGVSPHVRKRAFLDYAVYMAQLGRGAEVETEVGAYIDSEGKADAFSRSWIALFRLLMMAEGGGPGETVGLATEAAAGSGDVRSVALNALAVIDLMRGRWTPPFTVPAGENAPPDFPCWEMSTWCLTQRRAEDALAWARVAVSRQPNLHNVTGFRSLTLVRAELACGNGEAARRLMDLRGEHGFRHCLDGFFLARAGLLSGRFDEAARCFAGTVRACELQRAEARLDFELCLALELAPGQGLRLGRAVSLAADARPEPAPEPEPAPSGGGSLVGRSEGMEGVRRAVARFSSLDVPVLICGETGTGKELVARALHEQGARRGRPFIAVNCGAIAESLLESELFGHEKGAFTGAGRAHRGLFEEAAGGTLFLDEIGEMPARLQAALLRAIETGHVRPVGSAVERAVSCRVLAATNADLDRLAAEGRFRQDLLFRLKRLEISIPPLRDRAGDIQLLAEHFLAEGRADGRRPLMSAELRGALQAGKWPGNVRELRNRIERMRLLNSDKLAYDLADFADPSGQQASAGTPRTTSSHPDTASSARSNAPEPAVGAEGRPAGERGHFGEFLLSERSALRRAARMRDLFRQHGVLTRGELMRFMQISGETATRDLRALIADGFVRKVEPTRSARTHYFEMIGGKEPRPGTV